MFFFMTASQYWFRTNHRFRFSAIKFGKVFLGFTDYNYYLHGFLTLLVTYGAHLLTSFMMPWFLLGITRSLTLKEQIQSQQSTNVKPVYYGTKVVKLVFWIQLLLNLISFYEGVLQRTHFTFAERIAPVLLLTMCHTIFYFVMTLTFVIFWRDERKQPKTNQITTAND